MIIFKGNPLSTNSIYRRGKGHHIFMSKDGHARKEQYQWEAKSQWKGNPSKKELEIIITLYFGDRIKRDVDNYNKLILDAMSGIVYEDDKQIQRLTIEKYYDKENPRTEAEIFEL